MLNVKHISKVIDGRSVLEDVSFYMNPGSITGLVGRNGAGKTTLLRTLIGILDPDSGVVEWDGKSVHHHPELKQDMIYVPDSTEAFNGFTPMELADLFQSIYKKFDRMHFLELMDRFQLPLRKKIRHFSKGMKALVIIIMAFSTKASCILLDEPTNGIDAVIKKQVLSYLVEEVAESGVSVIISTHHLEELERVADTILMFKEARVEAMPGHDGEDNRYHKMQVVFKDDDAEGLLSLPTVHVLSRVGRVYTLLIEDETEETVLQLEQLKPLVLDRLPVRLEDLFMFKLGGEHSHVE
ncbi:ABC transporter ATP-binding protein [Paenibacillus swuensis]|uniref:ABC transporter ATP-binding protein n=1 Tax=Paenibacillus swuensis TaxID=1178515 RepID=A0A172TLT8_9BACL|nr:ABC transporter ATP-binding protein [Paenibacillus swuensis]ANE47998.1 ABC transporter ATP-binding protein [Paenibacillus swuensis]